MSTKRKNMTVAELREQERRNATAQIRRQREHIRDLVRYVNDMKLLDVWPQQKPELLDALRQHERVFQKRHSIEK